LVVIRIRQILGGFALLCQSSPDHVTNISALYTVKKFIVFPAPGQDVTIVTKLFLAGNNLIIPGLGVFG
jgi:hypothetical protein